MEVRSWDVYQTHCIFKSFDTIFQCEVSAGYRGERLHLWCLLSNSTSPKQEAAADSKIHGCVHRAWSCESHFVSLSSKNAL